MCQIRLYNATTFFIFSINVDTHLQNREFNMNIVRVYVIKRETLYCFFAIALFISNLFSQYIYKMSQIHRHIS